MTHVSRQITNPVLFLLAATGLIFFSLGESVVAQGLSGVPKRLEETVGTGSGDDSRRAGGAPNTSPQGSQGGSSQGGAGNRGSSAQGGGPSSQGGRPSGPGGYPGAGGGGYEEGMDDMEMEMDMEGMDEDMYGGGGYGGGRPSGGRSAPGSDAMETYGQSLISMMGDLDLAPLFAPPQQITVESGPVLKGEAEQAFKAGNHGLALELMFGHMTTEYKDAIVAIQTVKYSAAVKRPVWSIRWGVSMAVRGGDGIGDQQPIREGATPNRSFAQGGGPGGRGGRGTGGGDFEDMEQEMEEQMSEQDMEMDMDMDMDMEMEMDMGDGSRRGGAFAGGRTPSRAPAMPVRNMLSAEANEALDNTIGLVAKVTAEKFGERFKRGDFGPVFASVSAPEPVEPVRGGRAAAAAPSSYSMSAALNDLLSEAPEPLPMWQPGLVYLGLVDTYADAIPAARAANIDLILHFDVSLKGGRNGTMQNISRCRLIDVAAKKSVAVSKGMDNREAAQLATAGRMGERDYVEEQLSNLFGIVDRQVKVVDLPKLSPEVARRRISSLIASPSARSLRTLAEIRLYEARGLIDASEVEAAFDIIGGVDALMLLHGALDERIAMARQWAVESQGGGNQ